MKTILLSAGDLSGEKIGAELVRHLRNRNPDLRFVGMGGAAMAEAGVELDVDQRELAVGGIFEVLGSLPRVIRAWRRMQQSFRESRPDLVILIDSGGFNLPFAGWVRRVSNAKILYYVAPQVWAWRRGRMKRLALRADRIAVIFPFESAFYAAAGVSVDYVGHPALDLNESKGGVVGQALRALARRDLGLDSKDTMLGIFPGSRRNEIARHLPIQLEAFLRIRETEPSLRGLKGVVGLAPSVDHEEAIRIARDVMKSDLVDLQLVSTAEVEVADACDVALAKPGTMTLELMLREVPMVVMGRVHGATAMIARRMLKISWLAMPNLIAGEEIVPELMQENATLDRIASALAPLFHGEARSNQIEALTRAREELGSAGANERVASIVEELLGTVSA